MSKAYGICATNKCKREVVTMNHIAVLTGTLDLEYDSEQDCYYGSGGITLPTEYGFTEDNIVVIGFSIESFHATCDPVYNKYMGSGLRPEIIISGGHVRISVSCGKPAGDMRGGTKTWKIVLLRLS